MSAKHRPAPVVSFTVSAADHGLIQRIALRAGQLAQQAGVPFDRLQIEMDLTAVHANGCPLDLTLLLAADDFDFSHDVFGVRRHLDRTTGHLGGCFLPRSAVVEGRTQ